MNNIEIFLPVAYKIATVVWIQNTVDFEERRKEKTEQLKSINTEKFCMTQTFFLIHYSLYIIWTAVNGLESGHEATRQLKTLCKHGKSFSWI